MSSVQWWGVDPERVSAWCGRCGEQLADAEPAGIATERALAHDAEKHPSMGLGTAILDNFVRVESWSGEPLFWRGPPLGI
jgi:hypothetical protein